MKILQNGAEIFNIAIKIQKLIQALHKSHSQLSEDEKNFVLDSVLQLPVFCEKEKLMPSSSLTIAQ